MILQAFHTEIKKLVALRRLLDDQSIADILLVWSGFKPAAMVELSYRPRAVFSKQEFRKGVRALKAVLEHLSLRYKVYINYPKGPLETTRYSYVARNGSTLKKLIAADALKDMEKRRLRLGALLGYPKTATEAFANGEAATRRNLPATVLRKKELKFLNFQLSKKHWRKELAYVKKAAETIKRLAPELYLRVTRQPYK